MGSKFMDIYVADLDGIGRQVGSRDMDVVRRVIDAVPEDEREDEDPDQPQWREDALRALVERSYTRDPDSLEHEDADGIIWAFEQLCRYSCAASATVEMDEDEDETPLLWDFIWSDWDGGDLLELPLSPYGAPAVGWHGPQRAAQYRDEFAALRSSGANNERYLPAEELDQIIEILDTAVKAGQGVFVFRQRG
jgi:hypothetical protein